MIGPNGAGKTCVFNCITGFYRPDRGQILFGGENLVGRPSYKITGRGICRTFQKHQAVQQPDRGGECGGRTAFPERVRPLALSFPDR